MNRHLAGRVPIYVRVLVLAVLLLLVGCGTPAPPAADQLKFTAKTLDGAEFQGDSLAGKPAALWFWAPWCPSCQREATTIAEAAKKHTGITFVGVAARDEVDAMKKFVADRGMSGFPHLNDHDGAVWQRFGVTAQPALAFVDKNGEVDVIIGAPTAEDLDQRLAAIE